jgi:hypothetical protein
VVVSFGHAWKVECLYSFIVFPEPVAFGLDGRYAGGGDLVVGRLVRHVSEVGCDLVR